MENASLIMAWENAWKVEIHKYICIAGKVGGGGGEGSEQLIGRRNQNKNFRKRKRKEMHQKSK